MGGYRLAYSKKELKQLGKIEPVARAATASWKDRNIDGSPSPRAFGKALAGECKGSWRCRIGTHRVICDIRDSELVVIACISKAQQGEPCAIGASP